MRPFRTPHMAPRTLTRDELQALTLYAHGLSTDEVAQRLHVHHTVAQDWLRVAARKLGAANRVHAVAIAMELGVIRIVRGPMRQQLDVRHLVKEPPQGRDEQHWEQATVQPDLFASPALEDRPTSPEETPTAPVGPDDFKR
jgi:DNA-binding CsgD family transcriptional regulator